MASIDIHRLGPDNQALMRGLLAMFGEAFNERDTYTSKPPPDAYLEDLLARKDFIALVAVRGSQVVGGLVGYVLRKFEQQRSEIYIYDLAVAEAHRRKGIATRLIGKCTEFAAEYGAHAVFVQADRGDAPATALYSRLGDPEEVLHFDIRIDQRRPS